MDTNYINEICSEFLPRFRAEKVDITLKELVGISKKTEARAKKKYANLKKPRSCPADIYTQNWVRRTLEKNLATKALKPFSLDNPPSAFKASAKYFWQLPLEIHRSLAISLFDAKPEDREEVWKNFKLPYKEIEKRFIDMAFERTRLAQKKGYKTYVGMFLDKYKIPKTSYEKCSKSLDKLIEYCDRQLPKTGAIPAWFYSEYNLPCYICKVSNFPFKDFNGILDYVAKIYPILRKFRNKMNIRVGEASKMFYKMETDIFEITIGRKGNARHRIVDLIHELSHVIDFLQDSSRGINSIDKGEY